MFKTIQLRTKLWLLLIMSLATFLRVYNLKSSLILSADQAAAFLLADRIINHGHIILVGPFTSLWKVNLLAPTYYYLITLFYYFLRNELIVSYVFSLFGIVSIFVVYLLGRELFNSKTGLLAAVLYAISNTMISYSRNIWEPHLVPFFISLSLYLLLISKRKSSILLFLTSLFSFFVSLMYVSSFILIPFYLTLCVSVLRYIKRIRMVSSVILTMLIFLFFFILFYIPVLIYESQNQFPSLVYLQEVFYGRTDFIQYDFSLYFQSLSNHLNLLFTSIFLQNIPYYVLLPFTLFFVLKVKRVIRSIIKNKALTMLYILTIGPLLLTGIYQEQAQSYRLSALFPFILILFAYITKSFFDKRKKHNPDSYVISYFFSYLIVTFLINNIYSASYVVKDQKENNFDRSVKVARFIYDNAKEESFSINTIAFLPGNDKKKNANETDNHHSITYLYALQKLTDKKIFALLNKQGNWIDQKVKKDVNWIYLICLHFDTVTAAKKDCHDFFVNKEKLDYALESYRPTLDIIIYKIKGSIQTG